MNDKCAAGTGRFLEMIARTLEVSLDELGAIALTSTEKIEITSMCSVFAESEVISLIANNKEKADIAEGVCHAIANKAVWSGLWKRRLAPVFISVRNRKSWELQERPCMLWRSAGSAAEPGERGSDPDWRYCGQNTGFSDPLY